MEEFQWKKYVESYDERRDAAIAGAREKTIEFCVEHFFGVGQEALKDHGYFAVALSGGSTPKAIYQELATEKNRDRLDWSRILLFWSDERAVLPTHPDSNYKMAMEAGFAKLPISKSHIFRMKAESDIEVAAMEYEAIIEKNIPDKRFDLMMLGMGEDGHTASLFPKTHGLHSEERLVVANFIPSFNAWRMTLTFECINQAKNIAIYVIGKSKAEMLKRVLSKVYDPDNLPIQRVGTSTNHALLIADNEALEGVYLS